MIAVSLTQAKQFKAALRSGADYLELRTDYFTDQQLKYFVEHSTLPIIYTIKRPTKYVPPVAYIDLDYTKAKLHAGQTVIASFHDYKRTPTFARLDTLVKDLLRKGFVPKIATMIHSVDELYTIAQLQKKYTTKAIIIGMGELGLMTRVYNKSLLTYACVSKATATAPGQMTVPQLNTTRIFGLVGDDIGHSLSPTLHRTQPYVYQLWQTFELKKFMLVFNHFELPGASITKPFKQAVIPFCDRLDIHAKKIGAVNTLVRAGKKIIGYNTDWIGVQQAIGNYLPKKRVLILGRGGAAQAVAYAAKQSKAKLVSMLSSSQLPTTNTQYDIVVNATPVRDQLLVSASSLKGKIVMDCNYGRSTELVKTAQPIAQRTLDGLAMLKAQAQEQVALWQKYDRM